MNNGCQLKEHMQYYFAPLEGLTDSMYRRLHHKYFPGIDRYYMPFLSPTQHRVLTNREQRELPLADSVSFRAVPQILTKNAQDFLWAAQVCRDRGYSEVNLNIGCPSGTVVSKGKGAGMLASPDALDGVLDEVFASAPLPVSVKTRLGVEQGEEFPRLLEIFNQYPIAELIVHPRVRKDFYKSPIRWEWFDFCLENAKMPLCYNGNLTSLEEIGKFRETYPQVEHLMIGRGLIGDPGMLSGPFDAARVEAFHDELLETYIEAFGSERNAMFRMKENWFYLLRRFEGSEKLGKRLRKTTDCQEFRQLTHEVFQTLKPAPCLQADW